MDGKHILHSNKNFASGFCGIAKSETTYRIKLIVSIFTKMIKTLKYNSTLFKHDFKNKGEVNSTHDNIYGLL